MRTLRTIIILALVGVCLYVFHSQMKSAYISAQTYINQAVAPFVVKEAKTINDQASFLQPKEPISTASSLTTAQKTTPVVETPGPLQVATENFLSGTSSQALSIQGVITLTNENRVENGNLPALVENAKLDESAQIKLKDMFAKQYFEHVSPSGVGITNLADDVSYQYAVIGENLALGDFATNKALVDAWMASPGHRANILNVRYTQIGVAVGEGMYQGRLVWLAVQHFGMPLSACPTIDTALHISITQAQSDLATREADLATRKKMINSGATYQGMNTNQQVDVYNELVGEYNQLIADTKAKIATYNAQVAQYNACLGSSLTNN
jgi:uncharacterized protein YkwD